MLQRSRIERGRRGAGRVIIELSVQDREVQPDQPGILRYAEIAAVADQPLDIASDRIACRVDGTAPVQRHRAARALAGLVHDRPPRPAAHVHVDDEADPPRLGRREEGPRAEQTVLLGIGEQQQHVAARRRPAAQRPHHLQPRRQPHAVVGSAGGGGDRIIMRHQQHRRRARIGAAQPAEQIRHVRPAHPRARHLQRRPAQHARRETQRRHPREQHGAHPLMLRRTDRMRQAAHRAHVHHGPLCREQAGRGIAAHHRRRHRCQPAKHRRQQQHGGQQADAPRRRAACRNAPW